MMKNEYDYQGMFDFFKTNTNYTLSRIDEIIDIFKGFHISDINNKDEISYKDYEFLDSLSSNQEIETIEDKDISRLVFLMLSKAREKSHGAVVLTNIFIHKELYQEILDQVGVGNNAKFKINGVYINVNKHSLQKYKIIGICKSKFKGISYKNLIINGLLKTSEK